MFAFAARIPVYHHVANTLEGLLTIRAFQNEERFLRNFDTFQNRYTSAAYMQLASSRWFAICLDNLTAIFVILLSVISISVVGGRYNILGFALW